MAVCQFQHTIPSGEGLLSLFDRAEVISLLRLSMEHMTPHPPQRVTLVVMGNLHDGNVFRGEDAITVFFVNH